MSKKCYLSLPCTGSFQDMNQSLLVIYYYHVLVHFRRRISQYWVFIIALYWFISGVESVSIGYLLLPCTGSFQEQNQTIQVSLWYKSVLTTFMLWYFSSQDRWTGLWSAQSKLFITKIRVYQSGSLGDQVSSLI